MMQVERQKEWKLRNAQKQMEAAGQRVPADYCQPVFFYTLQFERVSLMFSSPACLHTFAADLPQRPGLPVSQTLRQEVTQLLLRFTAVRTRFVATQA